MVPIGARYQRNEGSVWFLKKSLHGLHFQSLLEKAKYASKRVRRSCGGAADSMGWKCATGGHYLDRIGPRSCPEPNRLPQVRGSRR
jgi:hypothetical protein